MTPEEVDADLAEVREWLDGYPEATVVRLFEARAWAVKGYPDWDALCAAEFPRKVHLPRPDRRALVAAFADAGMSTRAIASAIGVSNATVSRDMDPPVTDVTPDPVTGLDGKTYTRPVKPADDTHRDPVEPEPWNERETALITAVEAGRTVVANLRTDDRVIEWAEGKGVYTRIDRRTDWGNPFETPADGDRFSVIDNYRRHYLPYKPSLNPKDLRGRLLGCWCAPLPCHGYVLVELAELP